MSARALIHCINQYALQDSNPVIDVLPGNGIVTLKKKYPNPMLSFSGIGIRTYYHCHPSTTRPDQEHGHFHIFIKTGNEKWSHLAALSMDNLGQPIEWFTVNHWVTGETWEKSEILEQQLGNLLINDKQELLLVEKWLLAMLECYQQAILDLNRERDRQINAFLSETSFENIQNNHDIYALSQSKINLLNDLETYANLNSIDNRSSQIKLNKRSP